MSWHAAISVDETGRVVRATPEILMLPLVWQGRTEQEYRPCRPPTEQEAMTRENDDIEQLKARVSCAVVLERLPPIWRLDTAESTRATRSTAARLVKSSS